MVFGPSLDDLAGPDTHEYLAELRDVSPVAWVESITGWLVTSRAEALAILRNADAFTVQDERFSTGQVVGESMLSTDGASHARHRLPFVGPFSSSAASGWGARFAQLADSLVEGIVQKGAGELRSELAGPLAVAVIVDALGLGAVDHADLLGWYRSVVTGVDRISRGLHPEPATTAAVARLRDVVDLAAMDHRSMLADISPPLSERERFSNTAVVLFGAIETGEGMTANLLWHVLSDDAVQRRLRAAPSLVPDAIEESLRLEPAAAVVDRYATTDIDVGGASIGSGELVRVSLLGANRDPSVFSQPDVFRLGRPEVRRHLAFVRGPHACIGAHVARAETEAALNALFDATEWLQLDAERSTPPSGLIFRKPDSLLARIH